MDVKLDKNELRKKYKQIRDNIKNRNELSKQITDKILLSKEYISAKTICIYVSFGSELDTSEIIKNALKNGKIVGVPIIDETNMNFYKINSIEEIKNENKFGIREPNKNKENIISPKRIDLIIIPGICFDLENNRVGFGKGYYDKYLANEELTAVKIGICFKEQILKNKLMTTDIYNIKMDKVLHN